MEENERQQYETQAQELRAALKQFEGDWAKKNDGKKPGRNDIKANPIIGAHCFRSNGGSTLAT